MTIMIRIFPLLTLLFLQTSLLLSCASHKPAQVPYQAKSADTLPNLAAEFETKVIIANQQQSAPATWRLFRTPQKTEMMSLSAGTSDVWSRTSRDLWFYEKLYHQDKQVVQYTPVDLKVLGISPLGLNQSFAVNPTILTAIGPGEQSQAIMGQRSLIFSGKFEGVDYKIVWLPDLHLAARVERKTAQVTTIDTLKRYFTLASSPWQFTNTLGYRLIDYSDLGDMERDPFVVKIQSQMTAGHGHNH